MQSAPIIHTVGVRLECLERGAGASPDQSGHVFFLPRACLLDLAQLGHGDLDRFLRGPWRVGWPYRHQWRHSRLEEALDGPRRECAVECNGQPSSRRVRGGTRTWWTRLPNGPLPSSLSADPTPSWMVIVWPPDCSTAFGRASSCDHRARDYNYCCCNGNARLRNQGVPPGQSRPPVDRSPPQQISLVLASKGPGTGETTWLAPRRIAVGWRAREDRQHLGAAPRRSIVGPSLYRTGWRWPGADLTE